MSQLVNLVVVLLAVNRFIEFTSAKQATVLLSIDKKTDKFILNNEALSLLKKVSHPVRVIAAIGDARVGKSTALNNLHKRKDEEVFKTGDTMTAVTRGVWLSYIPEDGLLLLDVEGTDLGNDERTTKLSIFTALLSSSLMVFMKETPSNHIIQFLYLICRVSENVLNTDDIKNFPRLIAVMRGALAVPKGYSTTGDYIKYAFTKANPEEGKMDVNKQEIIGKFFPMDTIEVFGLPYVKNFGRHSDVDGDEYLERILIIKRHLLKTPEKKTIKGGQMNGNGLAVLAEKLVNEMNNNEQWKTQLPDLVFLYEMANCNNGFKDHIEPLLRNELTVEEIGQKQHDNLSKYEKICTLEEQRGAAKEKVRVALEAAKKRKSESSNAFEYIKAAALVGAGLVGQHALAWVWALSDARLKQHILPVSGSEYAHLGLQGVQWVWNDKAKRLGLNGIGEGLVAQEVEKLYPWAVTEGCDGYKRVNYFALKVMIKVKSLWM